MRSYRLLSVDPCLKGFGFVIVELPSEVVDHGILHVRKDGTGLARFERFIVRCRPDALILEDPGAAGSRRRPHVAEFLRGMKEIASRRGIAVHEVSRLSVQACFRGATLRAPKHMIASRLAENYPVLSSRLPPERKPWQSEDARFGIFDALGFAVALLDAYLPGSLLKAR